MKRIIAALIVLGSAHFCLVWAAVWTGTYIDDFDSYEGTIDDSAIGDWRRYRFGDQTSAWVVQAGELISASSGVCTISSGIIIGDTTWTDYEIEIQFRIVDSFVSACRPSNIGIGVRADDRFSDNMVDFGFSTTNLAAQDGADWGTLFCEQYDEGIWTIFTAHAFTLKQNVWHTVRISAVGARYQFFLNDVRKCDVTDVTREKGGVVLFVRNAEVHFDNVVIAADESLSISPQGLLAAQWGQLKLQ